MLQKIGFAPGINKQITPTGAEGQWIDCDNVRFRYGIPEKIGGWKQLGDDKLTGAGRGLHHFVNSKARKYAIIGTNRILYAFSGGVYYDIHPIKTTTTLTSAFTTTNGSTSVTITFSGDHGIGEQDIVLLDNFSSITNSNFAATDFNDKKFMVTTVPSSTTITITMPSAESGSGATTSGGIRVQHYYPVGPAVQAKGFGWSLGTFGGEVAGEPTTTLSGAINSTTTTGIILADVSQFPDTGTNFIKIGTEEISYTGISASNELTGVTREVRGTDAASHGAGDTVTSTTNFVAWGEAASGDLVLEPGMWSLDNFGDKAICLIHDSAVFEWNSAAAGAENIRATIISGAPTASRHMLVSTPDRHLVFFGTETTIGDTSTQDDMFIRFSDQEDINTYAPSVTNAAGTQRLQDGSRIIGSLKAKETILIWTDNALYTMKFIGAPFTFGFEQVGTNCGLIGKNAAVEVDGVAYWMSPNGFFLYDGTVKTLPCSVEDYVYDQLDITKGQQVNAGLNNLFGEVTWYYPTTSSTYNDQYVIYNYGESRQLPIWYIGTEARTSWIDGTIYPKPFGTKFDSTAEGTFPTIVGVSGLGQTTLFEHEIGTDQINPDGTTTTVTSNITSFDFDLDIEGTSGQFFLFMRRILPDFKNLVGNAKITMSVKRFPQQTDTATTLSPFTITSSTNKVDTRTRGRYANIKIENDSASESWRFGTLTLDLQLDGRR